MDIVRAFSSNDLSVHVTVKGDRENPLFRASDIGLVLENTNIYCVLADVEESDKVILQVDTAGGRQNVIFLTEIGLYDVLCRSRKPIAKIFRKWVCEVVREIRLSGSYTLQNQLELAKKQLEDNQREIDEKKREIAEKEEENRILQEENAKMTVDKTPVIYIYNTDRTKTPAELKIGYTINVHNRIRPYKQVCKFGKLELILPVVNTKNVESVIHTMLHPFQIQDEVFRMDIDEAKNIVTHIVSMATLLYELKHHERMLKIAKICDYTQFIITGVRVNSLCCSDASTQTEPIDHTSLAVSTPYKDRFDQFISTYCVLHEHAEVPAKEIVGLQRIVAREAKQEVTAAFTDYLKTRFKYDRLKIQNTDKMLMGYHGVTLKPIEYKRQDANSQVETFVFDKCVFRPGATVLAKDLIQEYKEWRRQMGIPDTGTEDADLKTYMKKYPHFLFETVWTHHGNGQGFYGVTLKRDERVQRISSTASKVEKRDSFGTVLSTYSSIAKAAEEEGMSAAKMSRSIQNKVVFTGQTGDMYSYAKIA